MNHRPIRSRWLAVGTALLAVLLALGVYAGVTPPASLLLIGFAALAYLALLAVAETSDRDRTLGGRSSLGDEHDGSRASEPPAPWIAMARTALIVLVAVLAAAFLAVLAYALLVAFPTTLATGALQRAPLLVAWLGSRGSRFGDVALGALIVAPYVWVVAQGTRDRVAAIAAPWIVGAAAGVLAGFSIVAMGFVAGLSTTDAAGGGASFEQRVLLLAPLIAGAVAGKLTGRASGAILAGFWCGLLLALILAPGRTATDVIFADRLVQTSWVGDPGCAVASPRALAACEIADDLGKSAFLLLAAPMVAAGLGGIGGLAGCRLAASRAHTRPYRSSAMLAPLTFSGVMSVVLVAEMAVHLW